jgi:hypothetical protein
MMVMSTFLLFSIEAKLIFSAESVPGFGPKGQVESLSYPGEVCDRLAEVLRESNHLYPLARRTMGVFEVGFMERV